MRDKIVDQGVVGRDDMIVTEEPAGLYAEEIQPAAVAAGPQLVERANDRVILIHDLSSRSGRDEWNW